MTCAILRGLSGGRMWPQGRTLGSPVLNEVYLIFILQHYLCNEIQGYFIVLCSPMKYPIVLTVLEQLGQ